MFNRGMVGQYMPYNRRVNTVSQTVLVSSSFSSIQVF